MSAAEGVLPLGATGALASLRARVRVELGLVDDAGGAIDVERALRVSLGPQAPEEALEQQAAQVLADNARYQEFVSDLTVGETHFLRHPVQLVRVAALLGPALLVGKRREVWCAGCASGEEAFSIALLASNELGLAALSSLRVLGTDISARAIAQGKAARYSRWSFRGCPPWLHEHFTESGDSFELTTEEIRRAVILETGELCARARRFDPRSLDIVLFRNVAIYFEEAHSRAFYEAVAVALKPGGTLIIGPADPRPGLPFHVDEADPDRCMFVVSATGRASRPQLGSARARAPAANERLASGAMSHSSTKASQSPRTPLALARPTPPAVRAPSDTVASSTATTLNPTADMERAERLADQGNLAAAAEVLLPLLSAMQGAPASWWPSALTLLGRIDLEEGLTDSAVERLRRAVFLASADPHARYWYGLALGAGGRPEASLGQLREAARLLGDDDDAENDELRSAVASALEAWS